MADSRARRLALVPNGESPDGAAAPAQPVVGVSTVVTLQRQSAAVAVDTGDEAGLFQDTLAEYGWARDVAGLAASTLQQVIAPVVELCTHYGCAPWQLTPRNLDQYFAGPGKRGHSTIRAKLVHLDGYFAFLEQRYAGEILRRFGMAVESPVDRFNRPHHRGDFGIRIPPSRRAMREFFGSWRDDLGNARKYPVAVRDYVMTKIAYLSGVRAAELCAVRITDVHWENGQWGRFLVRGKGARGSGPREREAYLFAEGRELLWWYIEEIRAQFTDDPDDPQAPLWPSERLPRVVAALNVASVACPVGPDAFRRALAGAATRHLPGPVQHLHPHLLRHACATHNYESGMPLWDVQQLLGHGWASTTVGYLTTARGDPERHSLESSARAVRRLTTEG